MQNWRLNNYKLYERTAVFEREEATLPVEPAEWRKGLGVVQGIQHALAAPATERAEHRHQGHAEKCNTRVILTATQWPPTVPLHTEEDTRPTLMKDFWDALSIAMASLDWPLSREETKDLFALLFLPGIMNETQGPQ